MPEPTATPTCCETALLICWSEEMLDTNALVSPDSTIAPSRATPSDEPSCWPVNCSPPASPRPEASTEDCTTLPSWEASSPMPTPSTAIAHAKLDSSSSGLMVARSNRAATMASTRPARTIDRIEKRPDSLDPAAEATNIAIETGSIFRPVSRASSPSTSWR